jgi:hypothetical protein
MLSEHCDSRINNAVLAPKFMLTVGCLPRGEVKGLMLTGGFHTCGGRPLAHSICLDYAISWRR